MARALIKTMVQSDLCRMRRASHPGAALSDGRLILDGQQPHQSEYWGTGHGRIGGQLQKG